MNQIDELNNMTKVTKLQLTHSETWYYFQASTEEKLVKSSLSIQY